VRVLEISGETPEGNNDLEDIGVYLRIILKESLMK
jgi:hypothetical protein